MIFGDETLHLLFSVTGIVVLLMIGAMWIRLRDSRAARTFLVAVAVFYAIATVHGVSTIAGKLLAYGYHPFRVSDVPSGSRTAVVILGSGSVTVGDWWGDNYSVVDRAGAQRVLEAMHVYRLIHPAYMISSGGDFRPSRHRVPGGETMRDALIALGVPRERILVETESKTTRDEAVIVAGMLKALPVDRVVLVTSESHMRRALGAFRAVGLDCVPAVAVEFDFGNEWPRRLLPSRDGLDGSSAIAHEIAGFAYYAARGWWVR